jgi:putative tricarboxylic transport membrane protein
VRWLEKIIALGIMLFSGFWAFQGMFKYGLWVDNGPGGGFLPVTIGLITFILAAVGLFKESKPTVKIEKKNFLPVLGAFVMILAVQIFGMIISSGLFIIAWLLVIEKFKIKKASILGISTTAVIYFVFKFFLNIPFPQGLIGI